MDVTITISTEANNPARVAVDRMISLGLSGDVIPGWSVVQGRAESRAEIRLYDVERSGWVFLFTQLRRRLGLTCAWLTTDEGYAGCILKYPDVKFVD